jgi:hypothetical protein
MRMDDPVEPNSETEQTAKTNLHPRHPSHPKVARRAYEISLGEDAGTDEENWHRAERELQNH